MEQASAGLLREIELRYGGAPSRLAPDTRPPSEAELAVQYGVARVTVRRAIALLRERGKLVTVHGRGSYVAPDT